MGTLAIICVVLFVVLVVIALRRPGGFTSGDGAGWFPWSGDGDSGVDGGGGDGGGA